MSINVSMYLGIQTLNHGKLGTIHHTPMVFSHISTVGIEISLVVTSEMRYMEREDFPNFTSQHLYNWESFKNL